MNTVLDKILGMIAEHEEFKVFKLVHADCGEIRFTYKSFIIIIQYEDDEIIFANGFKTFPKHIMDKFYNEEFWRHPDYINHYRHHESHGHCGHHHHHHHHCDDWCKTIPACNPQRRHWNSDTMVKPNPENTILFATLDGYRQYIKDDLKYVQLVIDFIDAIIALRQS